MMRLHDGTSQALMGRPAPFAVAEDSSRGMDSRGGWCASDAAPKDRLSNPLQRHALRGRNGHE